MASTRPDPILALTLALSLACVSLVASAATLRVVAQTSVERQQIGGPLNPKEALASFQLEPGLKIELVAAEPNVVDPVALCFDEAGRMYVAENRGYPTGPGEGQPPAGTIALLEDTGRDGRFEKRTTFAEVLTFPNGLLPWKGGIFVTCAPDVLYLKDTDGDGRADIRRVVFTGFATNKSSQLRVCYPTLGPDNWIYLSSGLSGGQVTSPDYPDHPPVNVERNDFRFRPDTGEFEAADGKGQFGMTFDDFGHRFTCMNRVHVQHIVLPARYLKRNPYLAFSDTMQNVPEQMINDLLKGENRAARIYPISANITTADSHAGTFTAACGVLVYRGIALPAAYRGQVFACDPTGNLVHWDKLIPAGATFTARRAKEGIEFLASPDTWFRPVFLANGPDGALYVCDMYRKTIEHPEYLPEEIRKRTDFDSGKGMGRIYRVVSRFGNTTTRLPKPSLARAGVKELVQTLAHPNAWQRETAHRLLIERRVLEAIPLLKSSIANPKSQIANSSIAQFHTLHILERLGALDEEVLGQAARSDHPGVVEACIQLAEAHAKTSGGVLDGPSLRRFPALDGRSRFQLALTLGELNDEAMIGLLVNIALRDADDRWARAAVLSSIRRHERAFTLAFISGADTHGEPRVGRNSYALCSKDGLALFMNELGRVLGAGLPSEPLTEIVRELTQSEKAEHTPWQVAGMAGIAEGMRNRGLARDTRSPLASLFESDPTPNAMASTPLANLMKRAAALATAAGSSLPARLSAISLLGQTRFDVSGRTLLELIQPQAPIDVQKSAVRALGQMSEAQVGTELLGRERWRAYSPPVQETVIATLLSQPRHTGALLSAIASEQIPIWSLKPAQRNQLLKSKDESIRQLAEALFKNLQGGDRMKVYEEFKPVLAMKPNPENGRAVFKQHCASCHRLDRDGFAVGPDLFGMRNQPKEAILLHVVVPDYEIAPGFAGYTVDTADGRTLSGLILSETPTSVTLRQAQGVEETILRSNMTSLASSNLSLMPQELEKAMTRQDVADLISYLKGEGP